MKHSFYVNPEKISDEKVFFSENQESKINKVLRLNQNDKIRVCDGNGCVYHVNAKTGKILEKTIVKRENKIYIKLYLGLSKQQIFELSLQKAVEIGVDEIVPVITKRSVIRVKDFHKKNQRYRKIIESAFCQCRRLYMPVMKNIVKNVKELHDNNDVKVIPYEDEHSVYLKKILENNKNSENISAFIGPEGGFEKDEIHTLTDKGFLPCRLTHNILRSETAAIFLLSCIYFFYGE
jgi:16S rRNA (uracil1498-N3)-methyltransferase